MDQVKALHQSIQIAIAVQATDTALELVQMLNELGCQTIVPKKTIAELLQQFNSPPPDLLFADLESVLESELSWKGTSSRQIPIILLSEDDEQPVSVWEDNERILGYLVRPFTREDLLKVITGVVRNQTEFKWLQQQCQTNRNLLNRLRQQTGAQSTAIGAGRLHETASIVLPNLEKDRIQELASRDPGEALEMQQLYEPEYLHAFGSIPHAVQEIDTTGRLTFCNPAHCLMHGYEPGQLAGRMIWELLATQREHEQFRQALELRLRSAPPPLSYVTRHRRRDGCIIDVQIDWTYKRDNLGDVEGYISIVTDLTQQMCERREFQSARREAETRATRLSARLAQADKALKQESERRQMVEKAMRRSRRLAWLGVFVAGIAHEINNPISAGMGSAEAALAMSETEALPPQIVECLVNIVHATRRCRGIVKDLLKFANQEPTEKQPYSLNYVVKRGLAIVSKLNPDWSVELNLDLARENLSVQLNMLEIEIAIANLIHNAVEASLENPKARVIIRTCLQGAEAVLTVSDNGCGIPEKTIDRIFDPFFTTRRANGGTGLGLSLVYAIVRSHRGNIEVQSTEGIGTSFTLRFPLVFRESLDD